MKAHITNLYNFNKRDNLVRKQHRYAAVGHELGFFEMGISPCRIMLNIVNELSTHLDGIVAAIEPEDVVFLQLPTENGLNYEELLVQKCKEIRNTKVILILHDTQYLTENADKETQERYFSIYRTADALIVPTTKSVINLAHYGLPSVLYVNDFHMPTGSSKEISAGYATIRQSDFYIKKAMLDAIEMVFNEQNELAHAKALELQDEIQIGFGLYDKYGNYSVYVGTVIQSIIEHTNAPICFHIFHDKTLNEQNRSKLTQVATLYRNRIFFHLLEEELFTSVAEQTKHFTIGTLFRVMIPEILPKLQKIIYLDADILVNRDIMRLWEIDIQNYCMAAVPDYGTVHGVATPFPVRQKEVLREHYINAGVLYMNLQQIRSKGNMRTQVVEYLQHSKEAMWPDQDALNVIYNGQILLLDDSWNYFTVAAYHRGETDLENKIYHFAGTRSLLYSQKVIDFLYYETIRRTPWGEEECNRQLDHTFGRLGDRTNQLRKLLNQLAYSNKKRIFYGTETYAMKNLYHFIGVREGDYRILSTFPAERDCILPCKSLSALSEEKNPFIVFVLPEADENNAIQNLEQLGLENEKDFFIVPRLLPPEQGGYI